MNEQQFCYWLKGFVELNPQAMLTLTQWQVVKDHLNLVFNKVTPVRQVLPVQPSFPQPQWPFIPNQPLNPPAIMC
jgi:hypothetical protein